MKLAKLSLAAIVVAGLATSTFAADTLADAFKNGKVSGELKAYYFDRDYDTDGHEGIFTSGLMLNYKTASFYGFGLNVTAQSSASPFASSDEKALFSGDMYGSGTVLSEAYLSYSAGKTTVLVGRMFLDTPLVASSGSRMTKQAFEGAAIINSDLPNTTLIAGYVQKFQARTDGNGNIGEFSKVMSTGAGYPEATLGDLGYTDTGLYVDNGAFTLVAINKSITNLTLTAAYAQAMDVKNFESGLTVDNVKIAYAEAAYAGTAGSFTYGLAAQYYYNSLGGSSIAALDSNNLWGAKASIGYGAFGGYVAYTKVSDEAMGVGVITGLGGGADLAYTGSPINSSSYANDTKAYKVGVTYAVLKNANLGLNYTVNEMDSNAADWDKTTWTAFEADYAFEGALKGLSTSLIYEDGGNDANGVSELWFKAGYKF